MNTLWKTKEVTSVEIVLQWLGHRIHPEENKLPVTHVQGTFDPSRRSIRPHIRVYSRPRALDVGGPPWGSNINKD